jgi:hypothetical protein
MIALAAVPVVVHVSVASEVPNAIDLDLGALVEILPAEVAGVFARQDWGYLAVGCPRVSDTGPVSGTFAGCGRGIWCHKCSSSVLQNVS